MLSLYILLKALSQSAPSDLKLDSSQNEPKTLGNTPGELTEGRIQKYSSNVYITVLCLFSEHQRLQSELNRMEEVEEKSREELDSIKEKMTVMQQELEVFTDLKKLESEIERKKDNLMKEKEDLAEKIESTRNRAAEMQQDYDQLKSALAENDSHVQVCTY